MNTSNAPTENFLKLENLHTGEILRMRRVRDADGQTVLAIDGSLPPKSNGPPPHVHFNLREEGMVMAGSLGSRVGNETILVPAGGSAVFPPGVVHAWWNAGDVLLEFNVRAFPQGTWIASCREYLPSSMPTPPESLRFSTWPTYCGATATPRQLWLRRESSSESCFLSFSSLAMFWASTPEQIGRALPPHARARP